MNRARLHQLEKSHFGFEFRPVGTLHVKNAGHRSEGRREGTAGCVFEGLTRLEDWLLSDDSGTVDLFGMPRAIDDRPMSIQQLNGRVANIRDSNRIQEKPSTGGRVAVLGRMARVNLNTDTGSFRLGRRFEEICIGHIDDASRRAPVDGRARRR